MIFKTIANNYIILKFIIVGFHTNKKKYYEEELELR